MRTASRHLVAQRRPCRRVRACAARRERHLTAGRARRLLRTRAGCPPRLRIVQLVAQRALRRPRSPAACLASAAPAPPRRWRGRGRLDAVLSRCAGQPPLRVRCSLTAAALAALRRARGLPRPRCGRAGARPEHQRRRGARHAATAPQHTRRSRSRPAGTKQQPHEPSSSMARALGPDSSPTVPSAEPRAPIGRRRHPGSPMNASEWRPTMGASGKRAQRQRTAR